MFFNAEQNCPSRHYELPANQFGYGTGETTSITTNQFEYNQYIQSTDGIFEYGKQQQREFESIECNWYDYRFLDYDENDGLVFKCMPPNIGNSTCKYDRWRDAEYTD